MRTTVIKSGGTVVYHELQKPHFFPCLANYFVDGPLVLVVSALGRKPYPYSTDGLVSAFGTDLTPAEKDRVLALGETYAVARCADLLRSIGYKTASLGLSESLLVTDSAFGRAHVLDLEPAALKNALSHSDIVVVPGFIARDRLFRPTTMGRESSDLSAVYYALATDCPVVRFVKDISGVFKFEAGKFIAATYDFLTYEEALQLAEIGRLPLCGEAVKLARDKNIRMEIIDRNNAILCSVFSKKSRISD